MIELLTILALPVLQSILAAKIDEALKEFSSENGIPSFEKAMKEAFIEAVKAAKGEAPKTVQIALEEEYQDCRDALLKELRTMQPADKKAYIDGNLLDNFRNCLLQKKEAFAHINMECLKAVYDKLNNVASEVAGIKEVCKALQLKGGLKSYELSLAVTDICKIPSIYSKRETVVREMKDILFREHSIIIYGTVKSGKSVASCLLAKAIDDYHTVCVNLDYKNNLNLAYLLDQFDKNSKSLFIIDAVKLSPDEWKMMATLITSRRSDRWLFVVNTSDAVEARILDDDYRLGDYQLPLLTQEEIDEMIPEDKREAWGLMIHTLFEGQPLLTHEVCVSLEMKNWESNAENLKEVMNSPSDKIKDKTSRLVNFMMPDKECYRLFNRLVLWNMPISQDICEQLAQVEPPVVNPRRTIMDLDGKWITKKGNSYTLSEYVKKTFIPDLLPQERRDCCHICIEHIKDKPMTIADIMRVIAFYIKCNEYDEAVAFYISVLIKLKEDGYIDQPLVKILWAMWMHVELDRKISMESALCLRLTQLILIPNLSDEDCKFLYTDIEKRFANYRGRAKGLFLQTIVGHSMLNNEFERPAQYLLQLQTMEKETCAYMFEPIQIVSLLLNNISSPDKVERFCEVYSAQGSPHSDILCEGAVMKVGQLYEAAVDEKKEYVLRQIYNVATTKQVKMLAIAAAARLIGHYDRMHDTRTMNCFYKECEPLCQEKMGSILINYAYGLGLMNHEKREDGLKYIEKAAHTEDYEDAYMEKLYASSLIAKEYGDKGDYDSALALFDNIYHHPQFDKCFTEWDRDAALGCLAYACWMAGDKGRASQYVMEIEMHLWNSKDNQNDAYKNMSMRLCVLVLFMQTEMEGAALKEDFARPDYDSFTKICPNLLGGYDSLRNFTMEYSIYCLAERYIDDAKALDIIDHMLGFQRTDGKNRGSLLNIMTQAFPLLLKHDRWDDIRYIVVTALSSAKAEGIEVLERSRKLMVQGFLLITIAHRVICITEGKGFDDNKLFDLLDEVRDIAGTNEEFEEMERQMLQGMINLSLLKEIVYQCIVSIFNFQRLDFSQCLTLLWLQSNFLFPFCSLPSGKVFFKKYVYSYALSLIRCNMQKFRKDESYILKELTKVGHLEGLDYAKKIIQGLYFQIKGNHVKVDKELESFLYD